MAYQINETKPRSTDAKNRYTQGGDTDVYPTRLGWWNKVNISESVDDILFKVPKSLEKRPDLIAFKVYGESRLSWLVLQYNNIVDIEVELVAGKNLTLPTPSRVSLDITNRQIGGLSIKR